MLYPQTEADEEKLSNFKAIVNKYILKELDGDIIKAKNAIYPRLRLCKLRGKKAAMKLVSSLCDGLINYADVSIIFDIMDANLGLNVEHNIIYSHKPLSFINLSAELPDYILHGDDYYISKLFHHRDEENTKIIKRCIKEANLSLEEINTICHYLLRQAPNFIVA